MSRSTVGGSLGGGRRWWLRSSPLAVAAVGALVTGVGLVGVSAAVASGGTSPYTTLDINVGTGPGAVAVDETNDTVYAANYDSGTVSVIDGATNTVTASVTVSDLPAGVVVDETTDTIYVANECASNADCNYGLVSVIDGATCNGTDQAGCNQTPGTIAVGAEPYGVGIDENTDTIYVTNEGSATVSVIDGATYTVTATVPVGRGPRGVAVDENSDTIYVTNDGSGAVSVIIPASVNVSPTSGQPATPVTVSGRGL